jgi:hypothetical protein
MENINESHTPRDRKGGNVAVSPSSAALQSLVSTLFPARNLIKEIFVVLHIKNEI